MELLAKLAEESKAKEKEKAEEGAAAQDDPAQPPPPAATAAAGTNAVAAGKAVLPRTMVFVATKRQVFPFRILLSFLSEFLIFS